MLESLNSLRHYLHEQNVDKTWTVGHSDVVLAQNHIWLEPWEIDMLITKWQKSRLMN